MTHAHTWAKRCLEELRRLAKPAGRMRRAEQHAGVGEGYLRKAMHQGRAVNLERFLQLLEGLGIEPGPFFARLFPTTNNSDLGIVLDLPTTAEPAIVQAAKQRWNGQDRGLCQGDYLAELDDLRFEDPAQVCRLAEGVVHHASLEDLPWTLGIYASACRPRMRYDAAWHALRTAFEFLNQRQDPLRRADLLRRTAFLIAETKDFERALDTTQRATLIYSHTGQVDLVAQTLVDRGSHLTNLGRHDEAKQVFVAALGLLPQDERRHRLSATLGIGIIEYLQGQPEAALQRARQARKMASTRLERGKAAWTEACAAADLLRWEEADEAFEVALSTLLIAAPLDAALSVCDHVRALLTQGQFAAAQRRAQQMRRLLVPLEERNPVAAASVRDLICAELQGERRLNEALLDEVWGRLMKSRRGEPRRL